MKDGTKILDIKPYLPYADSVPEASGSFAEERADKRLNVIWEAAPPSEMEKEKIVALEEALSLDPRPGYQQDPERIYQMSYGQWTVGFRIDEAVHIILIEENQGGSYDHS